jgi:hypothetical protein
VAQSTNTRPPWLEGDRTDGGFIQFKRTKNFKNYGTVLAITNLFIGSRVCASLNRLPTDPSILLKSWPWLAPDPFAC